MAQEDNEMEGLDYENEPPKPNGSQYTPLVQPAEEHVHRSLDESKETVYTHLLFLLSQYLLVSLNVTPEDKKKLYNLLTVKPSESPKMLDSPYMKF